MDNIPEMKRGTRYRGVLLSSGYAVIYLWKQKPNMTSIAKGGASIGTIIRSTNKIPTNITNPPLHKADWAV